MSRSTEPGAKPRGFRELGFVVGALALGLIGYALLKPSGPKPQAAQPTSPKQATAPQPEGRTIAAKAPEKVASAPATPAASGASPPAAPAEARKADAKETGAGQLKPAEAAKPAPLPAKSEAAPATPPAVASAPFAAPAKTADNRSSVAPTAPAASPAASSPPSSDQSAGRPTQVARQGATPESASPAQRAASPERATMKIQSVKSKSGVEAWLVEERSVPLLAMRYVFDGGNSQDPAGKEGLANFMTAMMDEGAGEYSHSQFQERMEELAFRMGFEDARDAFYGSFETLTANRDPSIEMLRLAVNKPRFEQEAVDRVKTQLLANLAFAAKRPDRIASKAWSAAAFPGHPYGRPSEGTPESVASITREDLEAFRKRTFARDTLRVVAVGDITAAQLGELLDKVFGELPAKAELTPVAATKPSTEGKLKVIEMDVPQSVVQFGMNGIARKDPDFLSAFVLNQILGGGGFASRLTEEVREKRGLAYSVYSYLQPFKHVSVFGGGVATKNEEVAQSIDVIKGELKRMADDGPTAAELDNAKSFLTGSFALRFDTNAKIANQLLWMLQEEMGIDYVEKRNALVNAVTLDDVKRVAKRLLTVDDLIITVVGKPKGLGQPG